MPDQLKFGLSGINGRVTSYPEALVNLAQAAESAGFESLWAGEHIILPESSTRMPATTRLLNPLLCTHIRSSPHKHHSPGYRRSASPATPTTYTCQRTRHAGCALWWPLNSRNWRWLV